MRILVSAGEASSDLYGAQLIVALRRRARADDEPLGFFGVGGERMAAAGFETIVESRHLAVVGMTEILPALPRIYGEFRKLMRGVDAASEKPAAAVVIDSPAFNFRVARELHARGVPVIYFVAPQLWAWREYRVRRIKKWVSKVLCIFPFELEFYRKHGIEAEYVGHPLADLDAPEISREEYARQNHLDASASWIALLPGSRVKEVKAILGDLLRGAAQLAAEFTKDARPATLAPAAKGDARLQFLIPVAPSLSREFLQSEIERAGPAAAIAKPVLVSDARAALCCARAAVVSSGTATVEAALLGTPFIAVYRLSALTFQAARKLVKVPHVAMPNLIAGKEVVPELLQSELTPESLALELSKILAEGEAREDMLAALAEVRQKLKAPGRSRLRGANAIERAADGVMKTVRAGKRFETRE